VFICRDTDTYSQTVIQTNSHIFKQSYKHIPIYSYRMTTSPNVPSVPRESEYVLFGCKCTDMQSYKHIPIYSYRMTMSPNVPIVPRESEYVLFGCKCTDMQSYKHIPIYPYRIIMSPSVPIVPRESDYVLLDRENKTQSFKFFHSAIQCNTEQSEQSNSFNLNNQILSLRHSVQHFALFHTITKLIFEQPSGGMRGKKKIVQSVVLHC